MGEELTGRGSARDRAEELRPAVAALAALGRLPTDAQADAEPERADRWEALVGSLQADGRVTDAEATALAALFPEDDSDGYGVAWTLLQCIEAAVLAWVIAVRSPHSDIVSRRRAVVAPLLTALLLLTVPALRVLVLLAILATLLATVALARRRPAAFAGLLVDVDVAVLAVIPASDPWVGDLRLAASAVVLLGLATAVGRLLVLLVVFVTTAEGVEELFYEAGHCCLLVVSGSVRVVMFCVAKRGQSVNGQIKVPLRKVEGAGEGSTQG